MSVGFTVEVEQVHPVAIVRPQGVLDGDTASELHCALLDCLAEQPAGILVDVSQLAVAGDAALNTLATVARRSQRWPGVRFVIAGGGADLRSAAGRIGLARLVDICPDRQAGLLEVKRWPRPPSQRERITPNRNAPGTAREVVGNFCARHGVSGGDDVAQLVASELVTNAVVHAGTAIDLTLRLLPPALHIAVRDGGDEQPQITAVVTETSETGRGLLLVDALATRWGSFVPNAGKVVWATVPVWPVSQVPRHPADQRGS